MDIHTNFSTTLLPNFSFSLSHDLLLLFFWFLITAILDELLGRTSLISLISLWLNHSITVILICFVSHRFCINPFLLICLVYIWVCTCYIKEQLPTATLFTSNIELVHLFNCHFRIMCFFKIYGFFYLESVSKV